MFVTVRTFVSAHEVWVNDEKVSLKESRLLQNHSEAFSWGYLGSGPAQTALGVCNHLFGPYIAPQIYQRFKFDHVAHWHRWDDGERSVNVEKFYVDYIDGEVLDNALSSYSHNVYNRLFAVVAGDEAATDLIAESSVINSERTQTRIIMGAFNQRINDVADSLNLSYLNVDGKWCIIGTMPTTRYLKHLMATAKNILEV